tara:strand:- start:544 stop:1245 length:702 start_codon:yes stop_codon:yes gene_type:complete
MNKGLVIGLGEISENKLFVASNIKFSHCFACGAAINLTDNLNISNKIMFLNETRLVNKNYWNEIANIRKEKQDYNKQASLFIDYSIPDEIWIFHHKLVFSNKEIIINKIRDKGFKGNIKIYSMRSLIRDIIYQIGFNSLFIDNKLISILDILLSVIFNKMIKKFGLKIPSSGIISILACLRKTSEVYLLGISLDRQFGYVNNQKYSYPKLGRKNHIKFDREILKKLKSKITTI